LHQVTTPEVGRRDDAPEVLKSYLSKRRDYVEWYNIYDGTMNRRIEPEGFHDHDKSKPIEVLAVVSVRGLSTRLTAIGINYKWEDSGESCTRFTCLEVI
jgi:hypothetical protein